MTRITEPQGEIDPVDEKSLTIYTIGHSNYPIDKFIALLKQHGITGVSDVRSQPYSRYCSQYNRENLQKTLKENGIEYVFLGEELGARREEQECYEDGVVKYDKIEQLDIFKNGLEKLKKGARKCTMAIMCAEKDPLNCHRTILISKNLKNQGVQVKHILEDGSIQDHETTEGILIKLIKKGTLDLFEAHRTRRAILDQAYKERELKNSYKRKK